jgi:hypothetical protein
MEGEHFKQFSFIFMGRDVKHSSGMFVAKKKYFHVSTFTPPPHYP